MPGEILSGAEARQGKVALKTKNGREMLVDAVVAGIGITPNLELAKAAGLQIGNGISVDEDPRHQPPGNLCGGGRGRVFQHRP